MVPKGPRRGPRWPRDRARVERLKLAFRMLHSGWLLRPLGAQAPLRAPGEFKVAPRGPPRRPRERARVGYLKKAVADATLRLAFGAVFLGSFEASLRPPRVPWASQSGASDAALSDDPLRLALGLS